MAAFDNRRFRVVGIFTSQSSNLGMDMAEAALIPGRQRHGAVQYRGLFRLLIQPLDGQAVPRWPTLAGAADAGASWVLDVTVVRRDAMLATFSHHSGHPHPGGRRHRRHPACWSRAS